MKTLFIFFAVLIAALGVSSCSKYYINTIESKNISKDEKSGVFKYENDSLILTYNFFGRNAPVQVTIMNKLTEPVYIDWARSAIIINDKAVSYLKNKVFFEADITGSIYKTHNTVLEDGYAFGKINGAASLPEGITFIPPNSVIDRVPLSVTSSGFSSLPDSTYKDKEYIYPEQGPIEVKVAHFTKDTSPLSFKSFLTFYKANGETIKPVTYQHDFYVSKSIRTKASPKSVAEYQNKSPNLFYTSKKTGYAKAMEGIGVATILVGAVAISDDHNTKSGKVENK